MGCGTNSWDQGCSLELSRARLLGHLLPCGGGGRSQCQERQGEGTRDSTSPLVGASLLHHGAREG